jgi:hypothetical protein
MCDLNCQHIRTCDLPKSSPTSKPSRNHAIVHDWFVWFVLEVRFPAAAELWGRPSLHLFQLFLGGTRLDTGVNAIGCQRSSTFDVPFIENPLLHFWVATDEVIKGLSVRLGTKQRKREIMVLEVQANTWKIHQRFHPDFAKLFRVTDTRPLENQRGAKSTTTHDDHLPGSVYGRLVLAGVQWLGGHCLYTNSYTILNNNFVHLGITFQVQVFIFRPGGMDVSMCGITATARIAVDPLQPVLRAMSAAFQPSFSPLRTVLLPSLEVLQIIGDREALRLSCSQEIFLDGVSIVSEGYFDWSVKAMNVPVVA